MIGQRVIGYWGAMWPYNYGAIISINDGWARVQWSDGSFYNGRVADFNYGDIDRGNAGVYFAQGDEPDSWFEAAEQSLLELVAAGDEEGADEWQRRAEAGEVMRIC